MKILRQQFLEHVAQTSPSPLMIEVARAEGVFLWTPPAAQYPDGQRFYDLISGVSVSNVGHGHPAVVGAVQAQAAAYMHTMVYGEMVLSPQVRYARRLAEALAERTGTEVDTSPGGGFEKGPGTRETSWAGNRVEALTERVGGEGSGEVPAGGRADGGVEGPGEVPAGSRAEVGAEGTGEVPPGGRAKSGAEGPGRAGDRSLNNIFFTNSGAEAIEGALKLAKRATGRHEMISFHGAYHGSTHGALSVMARPEGDEWRAPFEPLLPEVKWLIYNDFDSLKNISEKTACVLVEPVQGEAGVRLPAPGFLAALRRRCDETGALLIFDEIQTGMGRTGRLFAFENTTFPRGDGTRIESVVPDILCVAKAFGGGMPLGAFISSREVMGTLARDPTLGHITTFGGHPVCCAAGLAALEVLLDESSGGEKSGGGDNESGGGDKENGGSEKSSGGKESSGGGEKSGSEKQSAGGTGKERKGRSLIEQAEAKGAMYERHIAPHRAVKEVRRAGLLMAVELGESARMFRMMELFRRRGILSDWFLFCDTAFRISPPLTISEDEIRDSCAIIIQCLDEL